MQAPSLHRRVTLTGVAVTGLALLTASVAVYFIQQRVLNGQLEAVLDERADLVVRAASRQPDLAELAYDLAALGLHVTLTGPDGAAYVSDPDVPRVGGNLPYHAGEAPTARQVRKVVLPSGATAEVGVSRAGVELALQRLLLVELLTAGAALLLVARLLYRTTHTALRPLEQLIDTANDIAGGDHSRRLSPDRVDTDLGAAAAAFDRMLDRLEESIATAVTAQQTTRAFLDAAAHQLRTPIAGASTAIQTYRRLHPDPVDASLLSIADRETRRAGHLVSRLLRLAQLDHGLPIHQRFVDLDPLVREEVDRTGRGAPDLQIQLRNAGPVTVWADPDVTAEILANLIDNAARYATSRIDITFAQAPTHVMIRIADDGPGVLPDYREAIFERFTTFDDRSGTGLGLAIARELAQAQEGQLFYDGAFVLTVPQPPAKSCVVAPRPARARYDPASESTTAQER